MRKLTAGVGVLLSSLVVGSGIYFDWFNIGDKKEPVTEVDTIGEAMTLIEEKSVYSTKKDALVEGGALRGMLMPLKILIARITPRKRLSNIGKCWLRNE